MTPRFTWLGLLPPALLLALVSAGCSGARAPQESIDAGLWEEILRIRAIDNHAHPVRVTAPGEAPDRFFDALPVETLEAQSDPVALRPGAGAEANRALYGAKPAAASGNGRSGKDSVIATQGDRYPSWVLDQAGIDIMLANRVEMGPSLDPARFKWVPYADALIFPLDNTALAARNPDRKAFFALEDLLRTRYAKELNLTALPPSLAEYQSRVVSAVLERHKAGGAVAEKFEAAYLRSLDFEPAARADAERIYARYANRGVPPGSEYKILQDYLFRFVAAECGRLGMAVHLHAMAGSGGYFDVAGAGPARLQSLWDDPTLRKANIVMVHGGWPYTREAGAMLTKPNAWLDFSSADLMLPPAALAGILREWLEYVPEKVLFGTDAYPYSGEIGWEEGAWMAARNGRKALAIALTAMLHDGEISRSRASELARLVLRDNARALYHLP